MTRGQSNDCFSLMAQKALVDALEQLMAVMTSPARSVCSLRTPTSGMWKRFSMGIVSRPAPVTWTTPRAIMRGTAMLDGWTIWHGPSPKIA